MTVTNEDITLILTLRLDEDGEYNAFTEMSADIRVKSKSEKRYLKVTIDIILFIILLCI